MEQLKTLKYELKKIDHEYIELENKPVYSCSDKIELHGMKTSIYNDYSDIRLDSYYWASKNKKRYIDRNDKEVIYCYYTYYKSEMPDDHDKDIYFIYPKQYERLTPEQKELYNECYVYQFFGVNGHKDKAIIRGNIVKVIITSCSDNPSKPLHEIVLDHAIEMSKQGLFLSNSRPNPIIDAILEHSNRKPKKELLSCGRKSNYREEQIKHLEDSLPVKTYEWNLIYKDGKLGKALLENYKTKQIEENNVEKVFPTSVYIKDGKECGVQIIFYNINARKENRDFNLDTDTYKLEFRINRFYKGFHKNVFDYGTHTEITNMYQEVIRKKLKYCLNLLSKENRQLNRRRIGYKNKTQYFHDMISEKISATYIEARKMELKKRRDDIEKTIEREKIKESNEQYIKYQSTFIITFPEIDDIIVLSLEECEPPTPISRKKSILWLE